MGYIPSHDLTQSYTFYGQDSNIPMNIIFHTKCRKEATWVTLDVFTDIIAVHSGVALHVIHYDIFFKLMNCGFVTVHSEIALYVKEGHIQCCAVSKMTA